MSLKKELLLVLLLAAICGIVMIGNGGRAEASHPTQAPTKSRTADQAGISPRISGVVAVPPWQMLGNQEAGGQQWAGPLTPPIFGPNVDATLNNVSNQNETTVSINPDNDQVIIGSANDYRANLQPWVYRTSDGGASWANYQVPGTTSLFYGDPAMAFDHNNYAYFSYLGYTAICAPAGGMYVSRSSDGGAASSPPIQLAANSVGGSIAIFHDKEYVAVDTNSASPYSGNVYIGWTQYVFQAGSGCGSAASQLGAPAVLSKSTDHGVSWSVPITASQPFSNNNAGVLPVIGRHGEVYLYYVGAATQQQPYSDSILFSRSTDGGQTFPFFAHVASIVDLPSPLPPTNFRNNAYGAMAADQQVDGYLYAVWSDYRTGDADILLSRSTDNGNTWSASVRVNDDPVGNGKDQFFPWIASAPDGDIHISWLDRREDSTNHNYKEYYTYSSDHGATWQPNVAVSTAPSNPGSSGFIGDYTGIAASTGVVMPIWTDIRTGTNQNAYVARGVYTPEPVGTPVATQTAVNTPTASRTAPISTPTTTCCNPGGNVVSTCAAPDTYGYDLTLSSTTPGCAITLNGPVDLYFQVSSGSDPGGTWATLDHQFAGNYSIMPGQSVHVTGSFYEPSIPTGNNWYRVRWTMGYVNCSGGHIAEGYNDAALLCPGVGATTTGTPLPVCTVATSTPYPTATQYPTQSPYSCSPLWTNTPYPTSTPYPCPPCPTNTRLPTNTPVPTNTFTQTPTQTLTPTSTDTPTATPTFSGQCILQTATPNPTYTPRPTLTARPTVTPCLIATYTPRPSYTPNATYTGTVSSPSPTATRTPSSPTATSTVCTITFTDVPPENPFYVYIRCLACRSIVNGYTDGTFRPFNNITRGQLSKILSNSAGYEDTIPPAQQTFADVPSSNTFWLYIERIYLHGAISGYTGDGTTINPCTGTVELSGQRYFRWCNNATRGQIAKIDAEAAGYSETIPPTQQTFQDVPPASTFWLYIERIALHGVIAGYPGDNVTINPCTGLVEQSGQLYFRWCKNATRGQTAKIVANTFFPGCVTPSRARR